MKKVAVILGTVALALGVFAIPAFAGTTNQNPVGTGAMQSIMASGTMQKAMATGDITQMTSAMNTTQIKAIMGEQLVNQMTQYMKNGMMGGIGSTSTTGSAIMMGGTAGRGMMGGTFGSNVSSDNITGTVSSSTLGSMVAINITNPVNFASATQYQVYVNGTAASSITPLSTATTVTPTQVSGSSVQVEFFDATGTQVGTIQNITLQY